jgi:hypothetical protein
MILGHVSDGVLKVLAVLAVGGDEEDIGGRRDRVRRLNIESNLNIPALEYPRVWVGRFAFRVNNG